MDATTETAASSALDAHVREYLADRPLLSWSDADVIADAVASGWHAARADLAETLRAIVNEALTATSRPVFDEAATLITAIIVELEAGLGK